MTTKSRPTSEVFGSGSPNGSIRREGPGDSATSKQRATKRALKTFNYSNTALANTPTLLLESLNDTFTAKSLDLFEPIKIGRKVNPKNGPESTNGVFDSKVLSRNHAEIWFSDNKVWIKDVKSSNGTFVDGKRLSEEGVESEPFELHSGTKLEFGIDINNEDGTVMYKKVSCRVTIQPPPQLGTPSTPAVETEPAKMTAPNAAKKPKEKENINVILERELKQADEVHAELEQLREKLDVLEARKSSPLPSQAEPVPSTDHSAEVSAAIAAATADMLRQLEEARAEVKTWMDKYNNNLPGLQERDALQEKAMHLAAEVERLTKESQVIQTLREDAEQWKERATKAEAEIVALKERAADDSKTSKQTQSSSQQLKAQLEAAEIQITQLKQEKSELTANTERISTELQTLKKDLTTTQNSADAQRKEYNELAKAVDELREANRLLREAQGSPATSPGTSPTSSPSKDHIGDHHHGRKSGSIRRRGKQAAAAAAAAAIADEAEKKEIARNSSPKKERRSRYQMMAIIAFSLLSVGGLAYLNGFFAPNSPFLAALRGMW
ncbi:uncharacterized protein SPPG_08367 [Spizellomyces punctatus DAOM BR117]|uniref:FHA domain-containing protein n=1 Tax=Spizellomyces punctatus (strain DAOM BR117) TaxID=645134 RepID=A0A0L0H5H4_SPIPD|nr:uncharacterized protein SPPG_08367 [Spizellomyces punctatus DAOM BR117]KNC96214.1 hypothetical protein SPPG_08367 [Spizellomyces punctatus DAOM BR117]|eukprot:XP_016604254.1 hypothetical protein SPPG_08367 [Spizellomyces punctatus DAOM BR117]